MSHPERQLVETGRVAIGVSFYSQEDRRLVREEIPNEELLGTTEDSGLELPIERLIENSLFVYQGDFDGFRTRDELRAKLPDFLGTFEALFQFSDGSIAPRLTPDRLSSATEQMGVGAGLILIDHLFGTHAADWINRTGRIKGKDLDFEAGVPHQSVASDGTRFIVVETKGTITPTPDRKSGGSVYTHASDIRKKKESRRQEPNKNLLLGTIFGIPARGVAEKPHLWILDPPAPEIDYDPQSFKLLARLCFWRRVLGALGKPHLLLALNNRIQSVKHATNLGALDSIPLVGMTGKILDPPLSNLTEVDGHRGRVIPFIRWLNGKRVLRYGFIGVNCQLLELLIKQDFKQLSQWKQPSGHLSVELPLPDTSQEVLERGFEEYMEFRVAFTPAGTAIGLSGEWEEEPEFRSREEFGRRRPF